MNSTLGSVVPLAMLFISNLIEMQFIANNHYWGFSRSVRCYLSSPKVDLSGQDKIHFIALGDWGDGHIDQVVLVIASMMVSNQ